MAGDVNPSIKSKSGDLQRVIVLIGCFSHCVWVFIYIPEARLDGRVNLVQLGLQIFYLSKSARVLGMTSYPR